MNEDELSLPLFKKFYAFFNRSTHVDSHTIEALDASTRIDSKLEFAKGIIVFEEELPMVSVSPHLCLFITTPIVYSNFIELM